MAFRLVQQPSQSVSPSKSASRRYRAAGISALSRGTDCKARRPSAGKSVQRFQPDAVSEHVAEGDDFSSSVGRIWIARTWRVHGLVISRLLHPRGLSTNTGRAVLTSSVGSSVVVRLVLAQAKCSQVSSRQFSASIELPWDRAERRRKRRHVEFSEQEWQPAIRGRVTQGVQNGQERRAMAAACLDASRSTCAKRLHRCK